MNASSEVSYDSHAVCPGQASSVQMEIKLIRKRITHERYPFECHTTTTEDGIQLVLLRLPRPGAEPVLLQHGLLDSAWMWVQNVRMKSPAFALYDAGFDVWIGNNRGNKFTKGTQSDADVESGQRYWDHSFHEMGRYDVPALVGKVREHGRLAAYIGHSQGTMQFFIAGTDPHTRDKLAKDVKLCVMLSPIAYIGHLDVNIIQLFLSRPGSLDLIKTTGRQGIGTTVTHRAFWNRLGSSLCNVGAPGFHSGSNLCASVLALFEGRGKYDSRRDFGRYLLHFPSGTSEKNLEHFAQNTQSKKFRQFDYGETVNLEVYGAPVPPKYDLRKMSVPTVFFRAGADALSNPTDVQRMEKELGGKLQSSRNFEGFSHITWSWGDNRAGYYVDELIAAIRGQAPPRTPEMKGHRDRAHDFAPRHHPHMGSTGW